MAALQHGQSNSQDRGSSATSAFENSHWKFSASFSNAETAEAQ